MISSSSDAEKMPVARSRRGIAENSASLSTLFSISAWLGSVAGFGEGFGLLLFQRINWRQWARVMHVSKDILWISPVDDLCFSVLIALAVALVARFFRRI